MRELPPARVPHMNKGVPVLETATETTPVAVTLFPASERSTHTLSVTLKDCGVYKPMRPDSTGGVELLRAKLSICPQKAARNTRSTQQLHALNDEKYRMILQFAKILPLRLNVLYSFKRFSRIFLLADRKPAMATSIELQLLRNWHHQINDHSSDNKHYSAGPRPESRGHPYFTCQRLKDGVLWHFPETGIACS